MGPYITGYEFKVIHRAGLKYANEDVCFILPLATTRNKGGQHDHDPDETSVEGIIFTLSARYDDVSEEPLYAAKVLGMAGRIIDEEVATEPRAPLEVGPNVI